MFDTNYDTHTQYLKDLERQVDDARKSDVRIDLNGTGGWIVAIIGLVIVIGTAFPKGLVV